MIHVVPPFVLYDYYIAWMGLRQYEKKNGINQTLIYFLKGQHSSGQVDETLIHRLSGTPKGTVVYWTPQVIKSSSKESYESQAAIWSDDNYQIITR